MISTASYSALRGQSDRVREVGGGPVDAPGRQRGRLERGDRRLGVRGADAEGVVAVAAGVQHLQRDRPALGVHRAGDLTVAHRLEPGGQLGGQRLEPAAFVGGVAAGDDQADAATGALGEVLRQSRQVADAVLEAGVHRPHHHAVAQLEVAEPDRGQQVRVGAHRETSFSGRGLAALAVRVCAVRYSVSQSTQNCSIRIPPRSTRYWSSAWPVRASGRVAGSP